MHRLSCDGLPLPEIYVCDNESDARALSEAGIPFVRTHEDDLTIVKFILYRILEKKFPHIMWKKVLGINPAETMNVIVTTDRKDGESEGKVLVAGEEHRADVTDDEDEVSSGGKGIHNSGIADNTRRFDNDGGEAEYNGIDISVYCNDVNNYVNLEVLQSLGMLPRFMSDIADAIRLNIYDAAMWRECYNKKVGACVGQFDVSNDAPNLIILDISGSIPGGVSATMLQLIDSMRTQVSADLIVTGSTSLFWESGSDLPSPHWIRSHIGCGNESVQFARILRDHVAGRHYGNVISFGDYDSPSDYESYSFRDKYDTDFRTFLNVMSGTRVDRVMHYHTLRNDRTGYAEWVRVICPDVVEEFDRTWCSCMYHRW